MYDTDYIPNNKKKSESSLIISKNMTTEVLRKAQETKMTVNDC